MFSYGSELMKEIKAIIQPQRLEKVRTSLRHLKQFPGMTVIKVQGCSGSKIGQPVKKHDPFDELNDFTSKIMIITICPDHLVEGVLQIITECASTGQKGDGLVWITEAPRVIRLDEKIELVDEPPMFHGN
jgi:nitrogen regulatory protein P-II 1